MEFRPGRNLRLLYLIYLLFTVWFLILPWLVPVVVLAPPWIGLIASVGILVIVLFSVFWIRKFHASLIYIFSTHDITWNRGVWWHRTSIVPYNRITNIDTSQGPLMRRLGVTTLRVQTAGYSAPSGQSSEMRMYGVDDPQAIRNFFLEKIRSQVPSGVEAGSESANAGPIPGGAMSAQVLQELVRIREILETGR